MRWLLRLFAIDESDRRAIDGDLAELYEVRRRIDGDEAARRWLARERRVYPWRLLLERMRALVPRGTHMHHLWRDAVYSVRSLLRVPALSATIVLTVGVGLGATTAMIAVVRAVLVNPLPYANAGGVYWIYTDNPPFRFPLSVADYRWLETDHAAFTQIAAYQSSTVTVSDGGQAERVTLKRVTGSYFPLLETRPQAGRLFEPSDDTRGDRTLVLTHPFWLQRFGGDPAAVGRTLTVDGERYTIVGVLPRSDGPLERGVALFAPARWPQPARKGPFFLRVLGRLAPGLSPAAAADALHASNKRLFPIWKSSFSDERSTWGLQDLKSRVVGDVGRILIAVLTAVACVLLIACANAVNLLVARALNRTREMAIRGALGASRGRLLQHLFAETAVLTMASATIAAGVAVGGVALVTQYGGAYLPRVDEVRLGAAELGSLALLAFATAIVIGLVPAVYCSRVRIGGALSSQGRSGTGAPATRRARRALVAAEFALATPLIVSAVLIAASLNRLSHVEVGIDTSQLWTASVSLPQSRYPTAADRRAFWDRALLALGALPGVQAASLADSRPPDQAGNSDNIDLEDHPTPPGQNQPISTWVGVSPEFTRTVGLRVEAGQSLEPFPAEANVILVDRAWANRFFPGQPVVGRRLHEGGGHDWITVVGVVSDVKWTGLDARADGNEGTIYGAMVGPSTAFVVLRTAAPPASLSGSVRQAIASLDPQLALADVATGDDLVSSSLAQPRYLTVLIGMFALTALVLSIVGVYGVMAYFVQQHARDIGIRLALGGEPSRVRRMVVGQGLQFVAIGVAAGLASTFFATRLLGTLLFGVSPTDLRTLVGVPAALMLVAVVACLLPARRAARLDPAEMLRES
jgi:putative ABC transport system permease protein